MKCTDAMVTAKWKGVFEVLNITIFKNICTLFIGNSALDRSKKGINVFSINSTN